MNFVFLVSCIPWRPHRIALKEKIRRRTFRCAPPFFVGLASWSDVSRSNQAMLSQSRCLCRLFRFQSLMLQNLRALGEELLVERRILDELSLIFFRRRHRRFFFHKTCVESTKSTRQNSTGRPRYLFNSPLG